MDGIVAIYDAIHTLEEQGAITIGWDRAIYPTAATAEAAIERGDMYVSEEGGRVVASAIINQIQPDGYDRAAWKLDVPPHQVLVLHTLVVHPALARGGRGKAFVAFYEQMARSMGCRALRMDTNARNTRARTLYACLGYTEVDIVPTTFNGIAGVQLVCLEKVL